MRQTLQRQIAFCFLLNEIHLRNSAISIKQTDQSTWKLNEEIIFNVQKLIDLYIVGYNPLIQLSIEEKDVHEEKSS